jgi:hypothetical protein
MPYAIMQKELAPVPLDQLKHAFQALPTLTGLDAQTACSDAFGILLRGLELEFAGTLQDALFKAGVDTEVIEESELPVTPPAKWVKQMEFLPEHLSMYDSLGRSFTLPAADILLIAAGHVRLPAFKSRGSAEASHPHAARPLPGTADPSLKEAEQYHWMLELVLAGGVGRYSLTADEFVFNHLGPRLTKDHARNFLLLVQDLAQLAPHAGLNRGAFNLCEKAESAFPYPSKSAFFEELTWMLWRILKKG